ncbi:hypothetical protein APR12_003619 [Nocardia amikacinitolerans]|nr:hypothetical protein [Nocardia amikacinitolerans]
MVERCYSAHEVAYVYRELGSPAQLKEHGVRILESGQRVWLPMTDHPTGQFWVSQPVDAQSLPSRTSVIAVACQFIARPNPAIAW